MQINTNPANKIKGVYDLTEKELDAFYKGAGKVCILLDTDKNILAAKYAASQGIHAGDKVFDSCKDYAECCDGMFSACQFCDANA